jgi:hypothetical protein
MDGKVSVSLREEGPFKRRAAIQTRGIAPTCSVCGVPQVFETPQV